MKKDNVWSEYPQAAYTVEYMGIPVGMGAHQDLQVPGLWNIYVLHSSVVDHIAHWQGDPSDIPTTSDLVSYVVSTPTQLVDLAEHLNPVGWVGLAARCQFPLRTYYGADWYKFVSLRAQNLLMRKRNFRLIQGV